MQSDLPDFCRKPTVVLGVGNILFGDDGFGCAVVDYLESHYQVPEAVCLLDVGTGVRKLLFTLCLSSARPQRLLILDAIDAGRSPGEIFEIDPAEIPPVKLDDFSLHQLPTSNLLRELQETCGVEVRVLACQTGPLPEEISQGLSKAVSDAVPQAAEWLVREYFPSRQRVANEMYLAPQRVEQCWRHRMSPNLAMISDGKKFMWDGQLYDNKEAASRAGEVLPGRRLSDSDRGRRREVPRLHQEDREGSRQSLRSSSPLGRGGKWQ